MSFSYRRWAEKELSSYEELARRQAHLTEWESFSKYRATIGCEPGMSSAAESATSRSVTRRERARERADLERVCPVRRADSERVYSVTHSPDRNGAHFRAPNIRRYTERASPLTLTDRQVLSPASSSTEEAGEVVMPGSPSDCYTGTLQDMAVRSVRVLKSARTISRHFSLWKQSVSQAIRRCLHLVCQWQRRNARIHLSVAAFQHWSKRVAFVVARRARLLLAVRLKRLHKSDGADTLRVRSPV